MVQGALSREKIVGQRMEKVLADTAKTGAELGRNLKPLFELFWQAKMHVVTKECFPEL